MIITDLVFKKRSIQVMPFFCLKPETIPLFTVSKKPKTFTIRPSVIYGVFPTPPAHSCLALQTLSLSTLSLPPEPLYMERSLSVFTFKSRFGQSLYCYPEHVRHDPVVSWNLKPQVGLRYLGFEKHPEQQWPHRQVVCIIWQHVRCPVSSAWGSVALGFFSGSLNQKKAKNHLPWGQANLDHISHFSWP